MPAQDSPSPLDFEAGCFAPYFAHIKVGSRKRPSSSSARAKSKKSSRRLHTHHHLAVTAIGGDGAKAMPFPTEAPPSYSENAADYLGIYRPEVMRTIEAALAEHALDIEQISVKIHDHPEVKFEEKYAHDILTKFMFKHGFAVTRHYLGLATAWKAEFSYGPSNSQSRTLGLNSEMDALSGLGHACGHNLIAVAGVAVAIALKAALEKHRIPGRIVLLGTPAEEGGAGKIILLDRGAYDEFDACLMCHPCPTNAAYQTSVTSCLALQSIEVEYFGRSAHAGFAPWEGRNALDAAVQAYNAISALRQQIKPDCRVHGVMDSGNEPWSPNVIPDYAHMRWMIRAPTYAGLRELRERLEACLQAAGMATACKVQISFDDATMELQQNDALTEEYIGTAKAHFGMTARVELDAPEPFSTDFGNVSHVVPAFHPAYAIGAPEGVANHTAGFAVAARTHKAHEATLRTSTLLAFTGLRLLDDDAFYKKVQTSFENANR